MTSKKQTNSAVSIELKKIALEMASRIRCETTEDSLLSNAKNIYEWLANDTRNANIKK